MVTTFNTAGSTIYDLEGVYFTQAAGGSECLPRATQLSSYMQLSATSNLRSCHTCSTQTLPTLLPSTHRQIPSTFTLRVSPQFDPQAMAGCIGSTHNGKREQSLMLLHLVAPYALD